MDSTEAIKWLMFIKDAYENLAGNGMGMGRLVSKGIDCPVTVKTNGDLYRYHAVLAGDTIDALLELGKYKELEKQGKLLELPCPVGDAVYTIYSDEDGSFIEEPVVAEISNHRVWAGSMCFGYGDFGKTVFLTKAEAETALAGLAGIISDNGQTQIGKENISVWIKVTDRLPPENKVVETKVEDSRGCRNVQPLMRKGKLWFSPDGSIYVYYEPTHWRWQKI